MWKIWVLMSGFFIILEIITIGFLVFWFAIGSLFAMAASFFTDSIVAQTAIFIISSTALIILTRPLVEKLTKKDTTVKTNAYSIIGKKAIVTKNIDSSSESGQVRVNGEIWSAISEEGNTYEKGSEVEIVAIDGVKAIIK